MKQLTKTQWSLFIASAVTIILDYLIANSVEIGIASKLVPLITLLKLLYDQYQSFSSQNMVEFADQVNEPTNYSSKGVTPLSTQEKLELYKKKK